MDQNIWVQLKSSAWMMMLGLCCFISIAFIMTSSGLLLHLAIFFPCGSICDPVMLRLWLVFVVLLDRSVLFQWFFSIVAVV